METQKLDVSFQDTKFLLGNLTMIKSVAIYLLHIYLLKQLGM
jgi:hypothetical protein